jgi:predicted RNase H-like HicB family nuclease
MPNRMTEPKKLLDPSPAVLRRARQLLSRYSVEIKPDGDGGFLGACVELPGVIAEGDTMDACARDLSFAIETVLATYLIDGEQPPAPASREKRTEQVNVRFTRSEKELLSRESARQGFRGVGDLVRAEVIRSLTAGSRA